MKRRNLKVTTFNTSTMDKNRKWIENYSEEGDIINTQLRKLFRVIKNNIGTLTPKKAKQYKLMISDLTKGKFIYAYAVVFKKVWWRIFKRHIKKSQKRLNAGSALKKF